MNFYPKSKLHYPTRLRLFSITSDWCSSHPLLYRLFVPSTTISFWNPIPSRWMSGLTTTHIFKSPRLSRKSWKYWPPESSAWAQAMWWIWIQSVIWTKQEPNNEPKNWWKKGARVGMRPKKRKKRVCYVPRRNAWIIHPLKWRMTWLLEEAKIY